MKLLCKNNVSEVYDDGNFYVVKCSGKEDFKIDKKEHPAYPLVCCLKWDLEPVDINYLNELSESLFPEKEK